MQERALASPAPLVRKRTPGFVPLHRLKHKSYAAAVMWRAPGETLVRLVPRVAQLPAPWRVLRVALARSTPAPLAGEAALSVAALVTVRAAARALMSTLRARRTSPLRAVVGVSWVLDALCSTQTERAYCVASLEAGVLDSLVLSAPPHALLLRSAEVDPLVFAC